MTTLSMKPQGLAQRSGRVLFIALALLSVGVLAGCTNYARSGGVTSGDVGRASYVETGVVQSSRPVRITGERTGEGGAIGAVGGGLAGQALGGDTGGRIAGGLAGAVIGGLIGTAIERGIEEADGVEYVIRLDNGRTVAIVQRAEPNTYIQAGQRVQVVYGNQVRVLPAY